MYAEQHLDRSEMKLFWPQSPGIFHQGEKEALFHENMPMAANCYVSKEVGNIINSNRQGNIGLFVEYRMLSI